jgi:hypothetical protein
VPDQVTNAGPETAPGASATARRPARGRRILQQSLLLGLYLLAMAALLLGGLKIIDGVVARRLPTSIMFDAESAALTIRTLELYPYEGFHLQANFRHRGPMVWDDKTPGADFDVRTGDKGFFINFPLGNPPPKASDEFRVILVGGSGAQGWGGTRNETMFYSVLERMLNTRLNGRGVRVRVINLAMGGTTAYQNFLSLNRYAHTLDPDLILAYVGRNDFFVPVYHEELTDLPLYFNELNAFSLATRGSESPKGLAWLMDFLPNIMRRTSVGLGIKIAFGWPYFQRRARESYKRSAGLRIETARQVIDDYAIPQLVHSLKSVKRDFGGVPIMVAWQPIKAEFDLVRNDLDPGFYERMYERTKGELTGYMNDNWFFVNIHQIGVKRPQLNFSTHLDDSSHAAVGGMLAGMVEVLVPALMAERQWRLASGRPPYGR